MGHTGKDIYVSEREARHVVRNNKWGIKMRSYKCDAGEFPHWHVTATTRSVTKKLKKGAWGIPKHADHKPLRKYRA